MNEKKCHYCQSRIGPVYTADAGRQFCDKTCKDLFESIGRSSREIEAPALILARQVEFKLGNE